MQQRRKAVKSIRSGFSSVSPLKRQQRKRSLQRGRKGMSFHEFVMKRGKKWPDYGEVGHPSGAGSLGFHEFAWKEGTGEEWKGDRHDPSDPDNNLPFKPFVPRGPEGLSLKKGVAPPKKWFHHERRWEWTHAKPKDKGKKNIQYGLTDREVPGGYPNQKGYWPTGREVRAYTQRMGPDAMKHIKKRMKKEGISYKKGATDYRKTMNKVDRDFGWSTNSRSAHPNFKPWSGVSHAVRSRKGYVEPGPRGTGLHEFASASGDWPRQEKVSTDFWERDTNYQGKRPKKVTIHHFPKGHPDNVKHMDSVIGHVSREHVREDVARARESGSPFLGRSLAQSRRRGEVLRGIHHKDGSFSVWNTRHAEHEHLFDGFRKLHRRLSGTSMAIAPRKVGDSFYVYGHDNDKGKAQHKAHEAGHKLPWTSGWHKYVDKTDPKWNFVKKLYKPPHSSEFHEFSKDPGVFGRMTWKKGKKRGSRKDYETALWNPSLPESHNSQSLHSSGNHFLRKGARRLNPATGVSHSRRLTHQEIQGWNAGQAGKQAIEWATYIENHNEERKSRGKKKKTMPQIADEIHKHAPAHLVHEARKSIHSGMRQIRSAGRWTPEPGGIGEGTLISRPSGRWDMGDLKYGTKVTSKGTSTYQPPRHSSEFHEFGIKDVFKRAGKALVKGAKKVLPKGPKFNPSRRDAMKHTALGAAHVAVGGSPASLAGHAALIAGAKTANDLTHNHLVGGGKMKAKHIHMILGKPDPWDPEERQTHRPHVGSHHHLNTDKNKENIYPQRPGDEGGTRDAVIPGMPKHDEEEYISHQSEKTPTKRAISAHRKAERRVKWRGEVYANRTMAKKRGFKSHEELMNSEMTLDEYNKYKEEHTSHIRKFAKRAGAAALRWGRGKVLENLKEKIKKKKEANEWFKKRARKALQEDIADRVAKNRLRRTLEEHKKKTVLGDWGKEAKKIGADQRKRREEKEERDRWEGRVRRGRGHMGFQELSDTSNYFSEGLVNKLFASGPDPIPEPDPDGQRRKKKNRDRRSWRDHERRRKQGKDPFTKRKPKLTEHDAKQNKRIKKLEKRLTKQKGKQEKIARRAQAGVAYPVMRLASTFRKPARSENQPATGLQEFYEFRSKRDYKKNKRNTNKTPWSVKGRKTKRPPRRKRLTARRSFYEFAEKERRPPKRGYEEDLGTARGNTHMYTPEEGRDKTRRPSYYTTTINEKDIPVASYNKAMSNELGGGFDRRYARKHYDGNLVIHSNPSTKHIDHLAKEARKKKAIGVLPRTKSDVKKRVKATKHNNHLKGIYTRDQDDNIHHHVWDNRVAHHYPVMSIFDKMGHELITGHSQSYGHAITPRYSASKKSTGKHDYYIGKSQAAYKRHEQGKHLAWSEFADWHDWFPDEKNTKQEWKSWLPDDKGRPPAGNFWEFMAKGRRHVRDVKKQAAGEKGMTHTGKHLGGAGGKQAKKIKVDTTITGGPKTTMGPGGVIRKLTTGELQGQRARAKEQPRTALSKRRKQELLEEYERIARGERTDLHEFASLLKKPSPSTLLSNQNRNKPKNMGGVSGMRGASGPRGTPYNWKKDDRNKSSFGKQAKADPNTLSGWSGQSYSDLMDYKKNPKTAAAVDAISLIGGGYAVKKGLQKGIPAIGKWWAKRKAKKATAAGGLGLGLGASALLRGRGGSGGGSRGGGGGKSGGPNRSLVSRMRRNRPNQNGRGPGVTSKADQRGELMEALQNRVSAMEKTQAKGRSANRRRRVIQGLGSLGSQSAAHGRRRKQEMDRGVR